MTAILLSAIWILAPLEQGVPEVRLGSEIREAQTRDSGDQHTTRRDAIASLTVLFGITPTLEIGAELPFQWSEQSPDSRVYFRHAALADSQITLRFTPNDRLRVSLLGIIPGQDHFDDATAEYRQTRSRFPRIGSDAALIGVAGEVKFSRGVWLGSGRLTSLHAVEGDSSRLELTGGLAAELAKRWAYFGPWVRFSSAGQNYSAHAFELGLFQRIGPASGLSLEVTGSLTAYRNEDNPGARLGIVGVWR